jgi:hypothetical protein
VIQASGQPTCTTGCGGSYFIGSATADVQPVGPNGQRDEVQGRRPLRHRHDGRPGTVPGIQTITAEYRITGTIGGTSSSAMTSPIS